MGQLEHQNVLRVVKGYNLLKKVRIYEPINKYISKKGMFFLKMLVHVEGMMGEEQSLLYIFSNYFSGKNH